MQNVPQRSEPSNKQQCGGPGRSIPREKLAKFAKLLPRLARVRGARRAGARCNLCFGSQAGTKLGSTSCGGQGPQQVWLGGAWPGQSTLFLGTVTQSWREDFCSWHVTLNEALCAVTVLTLRHCKCLICERSQDTERLGDTNVGWRPILYWMGL